ncbi:hypothetical protein ACFL0M_05775 [Thermodesulfobacteriota bacterium]
MKLNPVEKRLSLAAAKSGMSERPALRLNKQKFSKSFLDLNSLLEQAEALEENVKALNRE